MEKEGRFDPTSGTLVAGTLEPMPNKALRQHGGVSTLPAAPDAAPWDGTRISGLGSAASDESRRGRARLPVERDSRRPRRLRRAAAGRFPAGRRARGRGLRGHPPQELEAPLKASLEADIGGHRCPSLSLGDAPVRASRCHPAAGRTEARAVPARSSVPGSDDGCRVVASEDLRSSRPVSGPRRARA